MNNCKHCGYMGNQRNRKTCEICGKLLNPPPALLTGEDGGSSGHDPCVTNDIGTDDQPDLPPVVPPPYIPDLDQENGHLEGRISQLEVRDEPPVRDFHWIAGHLLLYLLFVIPWLILFFLSGNPVCRVRHPRD